MFRIKICGITSVKDARIACQEGADAIGLNFYRPSPRCVDLPTALQIRNEMGGRLSVGGLFVNASVDEMLQTQRRLQLDFVQLHGDEPPETLTSLAGLTVVRALRLARDNARQLTAYLQECRRRGCPPQAILLDTYQKEYYGGTGVATDWQAAAEFAAQWEGPTLLAGGLTPNNVAEAIKAARPWGVDCASGVESAPGVKDQNSVRSFVCAAKSALGIVTGD